MAIAYITVKDYCFCEETCMNKILLEENTSGIKHSSYAIVEEISFDNTLRETPCKKLISFNGAVLYGY